MKGTLHEDRYTFMVISRSVLLRIGNVSDKRCRRIKKKKLFRSIIFFLENHIYDIMWKKCGLGRYATDDNIIWHMRAAF